MLGSYSSLDGEGEEILPLSLSGPHTDLLAIVSLNNYDGYFYNNFYNEDSYKPTNTRNRRWEGDFVGDL